MSGMPKKQMRRYDCVPGTASIGVSIALVIPPRSATSTTASTSETPKKSTAVVPMAVRMFRWSSAPTACAIVTVVPIASPTIMTVSMCMT